MVSTLPGPHDYRSAGIAPALDHVGAGVLEECQPIRVEYRGLDHLLVGTPHWITGPLGTATIRPARGNNPFDAGGIHVAGIAADAYPHYLNTRQDAGLFSFCSSF